MPLQAQQLKAIALKVRAKYCVEPARESAAWARKHEPDLAAPLPGLAPAGAAAHHALPGLPPGLAHRWALRPPAGLGLSSLWALLLRLGPQ